MKGKIQYNATTEKFYLINYRKELNIEIDHEIEFNWDKVDKIYSHPRNNQHMSAEERHKPDNYNEIVQQFWSRFHNGQKVNYTYKNNILKISH